MPAVRVNELPKGAALMRSLDRALQTPEPVEDAYAGAVLDVARRRAAGHPTPQARIAASGLTQDGGSIIASSGTIVTGKGGSNRLGGLLWGAERGSTLYPQFGPRSSGGYWLMPSTEDRGALAPAERALNELVESVVRRA